MIADVDLIAALRKVAGHAEPLPWDEGLEQRISQVAESYDHETRTHRPLDERRRS